MERLRRWLNRGKCDGPLTDMEKSLRSIYSRVLNLCNSEKAIQQGKFFDLMYVNYDNPRLNPHRHYAFLRYFEGELLVIVVNFGDEESHVEINIPSHAFEFLDINRGEAESVELLSGQKSIKVISDDHAFATHMPPHGAVVWKIENSSIKSFHKQ